MPVDTSADGEHDPGLPLFYKQPVVITRDSHCGARVRRVEPGEFARCTRFVPLVLSDIPEAAKHYPIVFANGPVPMPVALVGLESSNCFVEPGGGWLEGCYIPSYVRNYPFLFMKSPAGDLILCVDTPALAGDEDGAGWPLYDGGDISAHTRDALRFCRAYHEAREATAAFAAAVGRQGILGPHQAKTQLKNGRRIDGACFQLVDADRFNNMAPADIAAWHKNGYLAATYQIQQSITNWQTLIDRAYRADEMGAQAA